MNPRTLGLVSTSIAAISMIVAANLWRELRAERDLTSALQDQLAGVAAGQQPALAPGSGHDAGSAARQQVVPSIVTFAPHAVDPVATTPEAAGQQLLGDLDYRKASSQADGHAAALAQAGAPLDSAQVRAVAQALSDERKSLKQDIVALARQVDLASSQTQMDAQYALKRRQEESNQRVFDALYPVLSAQQMYLLRAHIEQQDARRAASAAERSRR